MERFSPTTPPEPDAQPHKVSRRGFILGAAASAAAGQVEAGAPLTSPPPEPRPDYALTNDVEVAIETLKKEVYAQYQPLHERLLEYTDTLERDVDVVLTRAQSLVEAYPEYDNFFQLLRTELLLDGIPEPTQTAVRDIMVCVPYVESRLDNEAESSVGAFGVMQLMPATWEDHAQPDDDPTDIRAQVRVADALMVQTYRFLMQRHPETFGVITEILYDGDEERCQREFTAPLMVVAYFSGMGTVSRVLDQFAHEYATLEDRQRMDAAGITSNSFGTYSLLLTASQTHGYDPNFGSEGVAYVPKALAARAVLEHSLPPDLVEELLVAELPTSAHRIIR